MLSQRLVLPARARPHNFRGFAKRLAMVMPGSRAAITFARLICSRMPLAGPSRCCSCKEEEFKSDMSFVAK